MQAFVVFNPHPRFRDTGPPADFADVELQERVQVRALYETGGLRQVWALDPATNGGAILFEARSPEHLEEMIQSFPLIKRDYAQYQVFPLIPHASFCNSKT